MVKPADARESYSFRACRGPSFKRTTLRRISNHRVDTFGVVGGDIVVKNATQMVLIEHDHRIDEFAFAGSHPALCRSILPWTLKRGALRFYAKMLDRFCDVVGEDRVVVCALLRRTISAGKNLARRTVAPAGSTRSGPGGDKWAEALREKALSGEVGWCVTLMWRIRRRSWSITNHTYRRRNVMVGTTKKSIAAMPSL